MNPKCPGKVNKLRLSRRSGLVWCPVLLSPPHQDPHTRQDWRTIPESTHAPLKPVMKAKNSGSAAAPVMIKP